MIWILFDSNKSDDANSDDHEGGIPKVKSEGQFRRALDPNKTHQNKNVFILK